MKTRITILVDNQADNGLISEHGLALWIEADDKKVLFDTGQGNALESNASLLGVDLSKTDILILSHGHYDHTGGIPYILRQSPNIQVYGHSGILQPRYSLRDKNPKPIQIPDGSKSVLNTLPQNQIHWVTQPVWVSERIGITGPVPRQTPYEDTGGPFYLDPEGKVPDPIVDDIAMWIRTDKGLIICVGCSHAGLVNTIIYVQSLNQEIPVHDIIGGFHLIHAKRDRLDQTLAVLRSLELGGVIPCHCTGEVALSVLKDSFGARVFSGTVGRVFTF